VRQECGDREMWSRTEIRLDGMRARDNIFTYISRKINNRKVILHHV